MIIGHHYTEPTMITIQNRKYISEKGGKLKTNVDTICQTDLHYHYKAIKEPIPKDTEIIINSYWKNFYGDYINTTYEGNTYDIRTVDLY
jgi:hypothetical protein